MYELFGKSLPELVGIVDANFAQPEWTNNCVLCFSEGSQLLKDCLADRWRQALEPSVLTTAPPDLIALVDIEGRDRLNPRLRMDQRESVCSQPAAGGFARNYGSPPVLAPHLRALSGYVYYILCGFPFLYFHFLIVLYNKGQFSPIKVAEYIVIRYFLK